MVVIVKIGAGSDDPARFFKYYDLKIKNEFEKINVEEIKMAKINRLSTISGNKEWYVVFDDSDSQTDYWHSIKGSQKYLTKRIKERGADNISVDIQNGHDVNPTHIKAVHRLAKNCGYTAELIVEEVSNVDGQKWEKQHMNLQRIQGGETNDIL